MRRGEKKDFTTRQKCRNVGTHRNNIMMFLITGKLEGL